MLKPTRTLSAITLLFIFWMNQAMAQTFTYPSTNYDEPYRDQFHFSAQSGWMNDVNGLWYQNGVYHMTYQHVPYGLTGGQHLFWGYATSPDMLHWTQQPFALIPGGNVPGDCWSGSTVVDLDNTSGLKTGANPVLVSFYTATTEGTCLAYSNDLGATWQAYGGNPVAIGGPTPDTRDPHVFWYAPTETWVCLHYENGTAFYTSKDLKSWTKTSHIDFGFECPDMYELPIDGNVHNQKWIVQDASGAYLVGDFDGKTFTPDPGGPYHMDVGPDFYASQTFFRQTFPDSRVIQLAWTRNFQKATEPWSQSATFPVELRLKTFPEGLRVTRTPIDEIKKLYAGTHHYNRQTLTAGQNLLAGKHSECCDIEAVFDLTNTTASKITFHLGDLSFIYDTVNKTLLGKPLAANGNIVKVRILRDWCQLEVFGNDGELSYTQGFGFTPGDGSLSIVPDDRVDLVSADFRAIRRTWPGTARKPGAVIDDADPSVLYGGVWNTAGESIYYKGGCHFSSTTGGYVEADFRGTDLEWWGLVNTDLGKADIFIDGARVAHDIDCYSPVRTMKRLFETDGLKSGSHTVKVVVTGDKDQASSGSAIVHDYFVAR